MDSDIEDCAQSILYFFVPQHNLSPFHSAKGFFYFQVYLLLSFLYFVLNNYILQIGVLYFFIW